MAQKPDDDKSDDERFNSGDSEELLLFFPIFLKIVFQLFLSYEAFVALLSKFNGALNLFLRREPDSIQFNILPNSDPYVFWRISMIIECKRVSLSIYSTEGNNLIFHL